MSKRKRNERGLFVKTGRNYIEFLKLSDDLTKSGYWSVQNWMTNLSYTAGTHATKETYLKTLFWFCKYTGLNPDQLIQYKPDELEKLDREQLIKLKRGIANKIQEYCDSLADQGRYRIANHRLEVLKSFCRYNKIKDLDLHRYEGKKQKKRPEYVPTKEEIFKMAKMSRLRDQAIILCLFQSGLRNSTLRALTYGDLKEQIESGAVPIKVDVTAILKDRVPEASKGYSEYYTFFGREACESLRYYLENRERRLGEIGDEEFLFKSEARNLPKGWNRPMSSAQLGDTIKRASKRAGIKRWKDVHVHCLRKAFRSVLNAGYYTGGQMDEDTKEFLMGHSLGETKDAYFDQSKVEDIKNKYMMLKELSPTRPMIEANALETQHLRTQLESLKYVLIGKGMTLKQIDKLLEKTVRFSLSPTITLNNVLRLKIDVLEKALKGETNTDGGEPTLYVKCAYCGAFNPVGQKLCGQCGGRLV